MHITKFRLKNFQCHKLFEGELSDGVNAIVGPGDIGKSAILRGITWCLTNQPDGLGFIRHWYDDKGDQVEEAHKHVAKQAEVKVWLSTGAIIERIRGKKVNRYVVTKPDGTVTELNRFGRGAVPPEVVELTQIEPVEMGGEDVYVQMQGQHDPYFLLTGISAPARWRALSHLAGTETADKAVASLEADIRTDGKEINKLAEIIVEQGEKLKGEELELQRVEGQHDQLQSLLTDIDKGEKLKGAIALFLASLERTTDEIAVVTDRAAVVDNVVTSLQDGLHNLETSIGLHTAVGDLITRGREVKSDLKGTTASLKHIEPVLSIEVPEEALSRLQDIRGLLVGVHRVNTEGDDIERQQQQLSTILALRKIEPDFQRHHQLNELAERSKQWRKNHQDASSLLEASLKRVEALKKKLSLVLKEAGKCPTCGKTTDGHPSSCS